MQFKIFENIGKSYFFQFIPRLSLCCFLCIGLKSIIFCQRKPHVSALVIGVPSYSDKAHFDSLNYAASDASSFYNFLKKNFAGEFNNIDSKLLNTPGVTKDTIRHYLNLFYDIAETAIKGDKIFIYWSGHGILDQGDQKLICYDTHDAGAGKPVEGGFRLQWIRSTVKEAAEKKDVKVFIIVDACRKSENDSPDESENRQFAPQRKNNANGDSPDGEIYMYSTCLNSNATEGGAKCPVKGGIFTFFLLLGLQGGASDPNQDFVTYKNLFNFIGNTVNRFGKKYKIGVQTPELKPPSDDDRITTLTLDSAKKFKDQADSIFRLLFTNLPEITENLMMPQVRIEEHYATMAQISNIFSETKIITAKKKSLRLSHKSGNQKRNSSPLITPNLYSEILSAKVTSENKTVLLEKSNPNLLLLENDSITQQRMNKFRTFSENALFDSLVTKITQGKLLEPNGNSAIFYYSRIKELFPASSVTRKAKVLLVIGLQDKNQSFMDDYLSGRIIDPKKHDFELAHSELSVSFALDTTVHPTKSDSIKLDFLEARALSASSDPSDWNKGFKLIQKTLKEDSTAAYMYHTLGVLYQNKGKFYTAIEYYDTALHFAPNWLYPKYNLGTVFFQLQEYEKSINTFSNIAKNDSNFSRIFSWIAYNYETLTDRRDCNYGKTLYYNLKALQVDSSNTYAYLNLGRVYLKLASNCDYKSSAIFIDSAKYFLDIGGLKYNSSQCLAMLGNLYKQIQNLDAAEYYFKAALQQNLFDTSASRAYANFLLEIKRDTSKVDSLYKKILDSSHRDYKFYLPYRSFIFETQSSSKADSLFGDIIKINSQDPSIFLETSAQWENRGDMKKAKDVLQMGLSYIPRSVVLSYAMARLFFKESKTFDMSNVDSSLKYIKLADSLYSNDSRIEFALSQVYQARQERDSATKYYLKSISLNKFIELTQNFNNDLISSGNAALEKSRFKDAFNYYYFANSLIDYKAGAKEIDLNDRQFKLNANLSAAFYIINNLDSAVKYNKYSKKYISSYNLDDDIDSSGNQVKQMELEALINIEKKNTSSYKKALNIFSNIDRNYFSSSNMLQKALCLFLLKKEKRAKSLVLSQPQLSLEAYQKIVNLENILYSSYFIQELNRLLKVAGIFNDKPDPKFF